MKMIELTWRNDEGRVKPMAAFSEADWTVKVDALSDWIYMLQKMYESLLTQKD